MLRVYLKTRMINIRYSKDTEFDLAMLMPTCHMTMPMSLQLEYSSVVEASECVTYFLNLN